MSYVNLQRLHLENIHTPDWIIPFHSCSLFLSWLSYTVLDNSVKVYVFFKLLDFWKKFFDWVSVRLKALTITGQHASPEHNPCTFNVKKYKKSDTNRQYILKLLLFSGRWTHMVCMDTVRHRLRHLIINQLEFWMRDGWSISLLGEGLTITIVGPTIKVGSHLAGTTNSM
jgi:hypothetical protein